MLLAGLISHTSTQYINFVDFLHFNGCLPIILLILVGVELPLRVVATILECCVTFFGVKLSIRSFVLFHIADSKSGFGDDFGQHGAKTIILCPFLASFRPNASWT